MKNRGPFKSPKSPYPACFWNQFKLNYLISPHLTSPVGEFPHLEDPPMPFGSRGPTTLSLGDSNDHHGTGMILQAKCNMLYLKTMLSKADISFPNGAGKS